MWNQRSVDTFLGLPFNIVDLMECYYYYYVRNQFRTNELIGNLEILFIFKSLRTNRRTKIKKFFSVTKCELSNVDILNGEFDYEIIGYQSQPTIKVNFK